MPRSLLFAASVFLLVGLVSLAGIPILHFTLMPFLWIGLFSLLTAGGLWLGFTWARRLAGILIFIGYIATGLLLISGTLPTTRTIEYTLQTFGLAFIFIALLTVVSGILWTRAVSNYFTRYSDVPKPKKT